MSLSSLVPLAGLAAGSLAAGVVGNLRHSLSFDTFLGSRDPSADAPPASGQTTAIKEDRQQNGTDASQWQWLRRELLIALGIAGIDTSQPLALRSDQAGAILVANNHPDANAIERLLNERSDLASGIRELLDDGTQQLVLHGDHLTVSSA